MDFNKEIDSIINDPIRVLKRAFMEMKENYNEDIAKLYQSKYNMLPLRSIVEESPYIFKEHVYGLPYFMEMVTSHHIPYWEYRNQADRINEYMEQIEYKINPIVYNKYESAYDALMELAESYDHSGRIANTYASMNNNIDAIYELMESWDQYDNDKTDENLSIIQSKCVPFYHDIVESALYVYPSLSRIRDPRASYNFMESISYDNNEIDDYLTIQYVMEDKEFQYNASIDPNSTVSKYLLNLPYSESYSVSNKLFTPVYEDIKSAIDTFNLLLEEEVDFSDYLLDREIDRIENASIVEENRNANINKRNENISIYYESVMNVIERIDPYLEGIELNSSIFKTGLPEASNTVELYNQLTESVVRKMVDKESGTDTRSNKKSNKSNTNNPDLKRRSKGINAKIQNAAIDTRRKVDNTVQKLKRTGTEVVNTAGALGSVVASPVRGALDVIEDWNKANENKRKQEMLKKPGRNKYYSALHSVIEYGVAAQVHAAFVPVLFFFKQARKSKDRSLRLDLINELKTEIKIMDEKIADYSSAGKTDSKYNAIRIKAKLEDLLVQEQSFGKFRK